MLFNNSTGSYGQVGWLQQTGGTRYNFTETNTSGLFHQDFFSASTLGTSPQYKMTFSSNAFHYYIAGTNVLTDSNTGYTGCWAEQMGEVTNSANQMPGGYNSHDTFTSAEIRRADTEGWYNTNGTTTSDNDTWYGHSAVSSSELDIWDKACSS